MANIFEITDDIRNLAYLAFSDLLNQLGRTCRLYYPPKTEPCNCAINLIGNKGNVTWLNGSPVPTQGLSNCPDCGGNGLKVTETYDDIIMLVNEDVKSFEKVGTIHFADGVIQTKFFIEDMQKVLKCSYMLKDIKMQAYKSYTYKLSSEVLSTANITQRKFAVCTWDRFN